MNEKSHRVVVSLTDAMHNLPRSIRESLLDCELNILDKNRLVMRMRASGGAESCYKEMQFDAVGYEDDVYVRNELSEILVQLFQHQRNCCLLRLTPRRTHNVKLMTRLLYSDVDKVLEKLPYQLVGINVEYHDLRKFDMINMLSTAHRGRLSRREMKTTREMFQWLHNEYSSVRGRGTGDDFINLEFVLCAEGVKQMHVNLAIFNIFDCNGRADIGNFFKELPSGKLCKSTLLTDCIKESFDRNRHIYTVVLCEMPLDKESPREKHKFLRLANVAFMSNEAEASKVTAMQVKHAYSTQSLHSGSMRSSSSQLQRSSRTKYLRCRPLNLSLDDHNKLAAWYKRIDKKFAEVKVCMERHYNVKYRQKFLKICKQLKNFAWLQDKSGGDAGRLMLKHSMRDEAITSKYIETLRQFRQLEKEVERSPFACTLSTYMSTKNYALMNAAKALQDREIANLQEQRSRIKIGNP
ncbi:uncharacterized protein LOC117574432 [Drosophila albomicans]|uniref:Uncharacterized protein LOC117574432 n=1 Tax=Drosophila albomicans TaxID=7291 RepID=A0A6P8XS42_DROAB|nr:uncharacterized protein LOC117574432 [Drosophila albomicans]